jgi:hypothetical protein
MPVRYQKRQFIYLTRFRTYVFLGTLHSYSILFRTISHVIVLDTYQRLNEWNMR